MHPSQLAAVRPSAVTSAGSGTATPAPTGHVAAVVGETRKYCTTPESVHVVMHQDARVQSCSNVGSRSRFTHAGVAHAILFRTPGTLAKAPGTLLTSFSSISPGCKGRGQREVHRAQVRPRYRCGHPCHTYTRGAHLPKLLRHL